jgi:sulfur carrier protein
VIADTRRDGPHHCTSIEVQLDAETHRLPPGSSLGKLLAQRGREPAVFATAVNGRFVSRTERDSLQLNDGDVVLLFQPIVGG